MPPLLKPAVRSRIVEAALEVFAAEGYPRATMAAIAERAGVATGNLYHYFPSKRALFAAAMPQDVADEFGELVRRRVAALLPLASADAPALDPGPAEDLLRFWIQQRPRVVILLGRAEGTAYAGFGAAFSRGLHEQTLALLRSVHPDLEVTPVQRLVLRCIFDNTRETLVAILGAQRDEQAIREAIQGFWSYQLAGLRGLLRWLTAQG
ncbi:MAG TPA: helix-turn-helix domain-containing protein [Dehalococcoidia bacterium]|nr:helix-turn-helix domain-containing protein [Dehalococcoidia bacterium]